MNRKSGGLIGKKVVITPTDGSPDASASGIWTLQDVADYEAAGTFPQPDVPPNADDIVANVTMQATETQDLAVTFSGASDPDGDTVFDWTITESSGALSLTPSSFTGVSSATTTFTASNVSTDTDVDITVTVTDQYGLSASKVFTGTDAFTITNNIAPVVTSVAPTNVSFPLDVNESATQVITFSGATDTEDTDTTLKYEIINISPSAAITSVTPSSDSSSPFTFTFNTAAVTADTNVSFGVKVTDSIGDSSTKTFANALVVKENIVPNISGLTHNGELPATLNKSTTTAITWSGATDPDGTDSNIDYSVVSITNDPNGYLTTTGGVDGADINFIIGNVAADTAITFKIRCTDEANGYTDSAAYNVTLKAVVFTAATGGSSVTESGDYKVHKFTGSSTFTVTTLGTDATVNFLVIAGGGNSAVYTGAGGAGGYRSSWNSETSGGGCASESSVTVSATAYTVTVGGAHSNSSALGITSTRGGSGGTANGESGGSGGGGKSGSKQPPGYGGGGTACQGYGGGTSTGNYSCAGGGAGGGASGSKAKNGGAGRSSTISGSTVCLAGGGGAYQGSQSCGGGSRGGSGGAANTGGGAGASISGTRYGGSGIVYISYKFQ